MSKENQKQALKTSDRRKGHRYRFHATIEVVDPASGKCLRADLSDLSQQGCRIDTREPFPTGTAVQVRIDKGKTSLVAQARTVFAREKSDMGLLFTAIEPRSVRVLNDWLGEARESAWLAFSRRRSQRVLLALPLRVVGKDSRGAVFEEMTETAAVSAHGGLILLSMALSRGHALTLFNIRTRSAAECIVVHVGETHGKRVRVGVEFLLPSPAFWHVSFPPPDWSPRHADAKKILQSVP